MRALGGPALIVVGTAIVLRGFWLGGHLTNQHIDLLSFWLPRWCYLGTSVSSGHVPTWLPHQFGGVPFVSDPQSGWLYAPVMSLFSTLSCARALDVMIVLNPIVAGLGMYVFFRKEGLGRPAATVGGLTVSLSMASSVVVLSMPFSGSLAWTAVSLAGVAGYLHARTPVQALAWLGLSAFGLSQVASAQMTDGLLIAALTLGPYLVVRSIRQVRAGHRRALTAVVMALGLVAAFPLLAGAVLVPRLSLLPRMSIGHGYVELGNLASQLGGFPVSAPIAKGGVNPWWGTAFARGPSGYVGAATILLIPIAVTSRRWRAPALAFTVTGLIGWILNLDWLIRTNAIRSFALKNSLGQLWLRSPDRFKYLLILAFAGLAGYGVQAWLDLEVVRTRRAVLSRCVWWLPAIVLFVVAPLIVGSPIAAYIAFFAGFVAVVPFLVAAARGTRWAAAVLPVVIALELVTVGVVASANAGAAGEGREGVPTGAFGHAFGRIRTPAIAPPSYLIPGPIGQTLVAARAGGDLGRYLSFDPKQTQTRRGWLARQAPRFWPAYENGRSILFDIYEIQGYSTIQIDRYWRLVRRVATRPITYNGATFQTVRPEVLRLFGVEWLIIPTGMEPPVAGTPTTDEGGYTLYRIASAEPRVSVVFDWSEVPPGGGLDLVLGSGFDPSRRAIVEAAPSVQGRPIAASGSGTGAVSYTEASPEDVQVRVTADAPGLVVIRNPFDRNWHATVDGRPAPLMVTDYLMQGVAVPAGDHTVQLTYRDRAVGYGILLSGLAWAVLFGAMVWFAVTGRRRRDENDTVENPSENPSENPAEPLSASQPSPP